MKTRQILAILGIIALVGMYIATFVCALSSSENFMGMLMASIYATIVIPVLIWAITMVQKLMKKDDDKNEEEK